MSDSWAAIIGLIAAITLLGVYGAVLRLFVGTKYIPNYSDDFWKCFKRSLFDAATFIPIYAIGLILIVVTLEPGSDWLIPLLALGIFLGHTLVTLRDIYSDHKQRQIANHQLDKFARAQSNADSIKRFESDELLRDLHGLKPGESLKDHLDDYISGLDNPDENKR